MVVCSFTKSNSDAWTLSSPVIFTVHVESCIYHSPRPHIVDVNWYMVCTYPYVPDQESHSLQCHFLLDAISCFRCTACTIWDGKLKRIETGKQDFWHHKSGGQLYYSATQVLRILGTSRKSEAQPYFDSQYTSTT